jgi:diguanylate cyclase (GGDEF)-like protein/PAS domain S-box-containing protein
MENNFRFYDVCVVPEYFDHKIVSVLLIGRDITERKEAENALRASENRLRLIVENSPDGLFQQDRDLRYTWLPGQFFCGIAARNLLGKTDSDFFPRDEARRMTEMKQKVMETGVGIRTDIHMLVGGREKYFDVFYEPWRSHAGEITGIVGYVRDITERKCAEKALEVSEKKYMELSITDPLTSLFNLRHFYDSLRTEIERVNRYHFPLSILMLDIDNFKSVNDRYGHYEGDNVLKRMGDIMKRYIRQVDSAYRYGGEEFTLILPETESEEAIQVAERIRQGFKTENFSPKIDEKVHLTVSIGVARYFPKEELIAFLKRVDENLYRAKAQGKDRVYYHEKGGESSFLM